METPALMSRDMAFGVYKYDFFKLQVQEKESPNTEFAITYPETLFQIKVMNAPILTTATLSLQDLDMKKPLEELRRRLPAPD